MAEQTQGPLQGTGEKSSTTDQILDLLLDALAERQRGRTPSPRPSPSGEREAPPSPQGEREAPVPRPVPPVSEQRRGAAQPAPAARPKREPRPGEEGWPAQGEAGTGQPPAKLPSIDMGKFILRLVIVIAALVVLINIPVNRYGVSLARIMPESSSLIIRDGLVLKGSGPEIYMLEDNKLRWISSLDAFEHRSLTWEDVHVVDDKFLEQFEKGRPIHVLLKCDGSPHVYRLENKQKRWIKDIDTFTAEGHQWEDVRFVSCEYLRGIPDGKPIPEDAGPPPQP